MTTATTLQKETDSEHQTLLSSPQWNTLGHCLEDLLAAYFAELQGYEPKQLYSLVLEAVEIPLLTSVMQKCGGNQTRAAAMLGISRMTLRNKLKHYKLLEKTS